MHIISKPTIIIFYEKYPDAKNPLISWWKTMHRKTFTDFNDLQTVFPSADYVNGLTVFNIGGNKYRLIASIHYNRKKVFIRAVLTHHEYDCGEWKQRK